MYYIINTIIFRYWRGWVIIFTYYVSAYIQFWQIFRFVFELWHKLLQIITSSRYECYDNSYNINNYIGTSALYTLMVCNILHIVIYFIPDLCNTIYILLQQFNIVYMQFASIFRWKNIMFISLNGQRWISGFNGVYLGGRSRLRLVKNNVCNLSLIFNQCDYAP